LERISAKTISSISVRSNRSTGLPFPCSARRSRARYLAPDAAAAEAVTQETYLRAWRDFGCHSDDGVKPWLLAILCQVLRTAPQRDAHNDLVSQGAGQMPDAAEANPVDEFEAADLRRSIFGLPAALRETLVLKEFGRLSYREIAEATGVAVATVMSRLMLAREAMQPRSSR